MIYVGTDMAKEKFDACTLDGEGNLISAEECANNTTGFQRFVEYLNGIPGVSVSLVVEAGSFTASA
ncbi:MAG: IS110 family transposase [Candidatus Thermoplasmatota archaeon]|nr:IS110 family transposase [Candidatus Thermoplasmatota archaeon]